MHYNFAYFSYMKYLNWCLLNKCLKDYIQEYVNTIRRVMNFISLYFITILMYSFKRITPRNIWNMNQISRFLSISWWNKSMYGIMIYNLNWCIQRILMKSRRPTMNLFNLLHQVNSTHHLTPKNIHKNLWLEEYKYTNLFIILYTQTSSLLLVKIYCTKYHSKVRYFFVRIHNFTSIYVFINTALYKDII